MDSIEFDMPKPHRIDKDAPCDVVSSDGDASHCWHWMGSQEQPEDYACCACQGYYTAPSVATTSKGGDDAE